MHDIGQIIWVLVVVIGVISSIRKNAAKNRARPAAKAAPKPAMAAMTPPPVPVSAPARVVIPRSAFEPPPVADAPAPPAPAAFTFPGLAVRPIGTGLVRGMFEGPATLVRAIVAAEILGPPKSLQEQSIWSPRHNEPSI